MSKTYWLNLHRAKPPLSANSSFGWQKKARIVKKLRGDTKIAARVAGVPRDQAHIHVNLLYIPKHKRIRDASNLMPTQKAAVDGLRDAGIVPDDDARYVTEHMPQIAPADPTVIETHRLWLKVIIPS